MVEGLSKGLSVSGHATLTYFGRVAFSEAELPIFCILLNVIRWILWYDRCQYKNQSRYSRTAD